MRKLTLVMIAVVITLTAVGLAGGYQKIRTLLKPGPNADGQGITLPVGWRITPAGRHVPLPGDMAMKIMKGLVKRLREADKKIETLALLDVYGRVARVLLDFSENVNGERVVKSKLPRQEIAKMIGASREMVSRVMKGLEIDGYIVPMGEGKLVLREKISSYLS